MSAQTDFHITVDRAAGLCLDASCAIRSARANPLPHPHRRLLERAIVNLDRAQDDLFKARHDPWSQAASKPKRHRQLELL